MGDAVEAINRISGASGVTAKVDNNKVVLDADGDDITIENTKVGTEFVDLVVEKLGEDGAVSTYNLYELARALPLLTRKQRLLRRMALWLTMQTRLTL